MDRDEEDKEQELASGQRMKEIFNVDLGPKRAVDSSVFRKKYGPTDYGAPVEIINLNTNDKQLRRER